MATPAAKRGKMQVEALMDETPEKQPEIFKPDLQLGGATGSSSSRAMVQILTPRKPTTGGLRSDSSSSGPEGDGLPPIPNIALSE